MSGDVQPRKRKDKKRKKDELIAGSEEVHTAGPGARGTAAIFGEGDVFIHTHHDHGTGGHWCAKVIFFSLLAVLITLIGLIILENRGLSELEANSVESRYASVLEGWLEDAPDDDHHDEHTLELNHPDDDEDSGELQSAYQNGDHEDDEELGDDEEEDHEDADHEAEDEEQSQEDEPDLEDENNASEDEDDEEKDLSQQTYGYDDEDEQHNAQEDENYDEHELRDEHEDPEDEQQDYQTEQGFDEEENEVDEQGSDDNDDAYSSKELEGTPDDADSQENYDQENEDEEHDDEDDHDEDEETEVEHIEEEPDEEPISLELPALPQPDEDDDDQEKGDADDDDEADDQGEAEDDDFLEHDEIDNEPPVVERITAPAGKPFEEVEDEDSSEPPSADTLADEEEYERRQAQLRRDQEQASHMWLKLGVGAALLLATHAVMRRAVAPRDEPAKEEESDTVREETPVSDRRMTLITEEPTPPVTPRFIPQPPQKRVITEEMMMKQIPSIVQSAPTPKQTSVEEEENLEEEEEEIKPPKTDSPAPKEELYSDEEIEEEEEEEDEVIAPKNAEPKQGAPAAPKKEEPKPKEETPEPEEDVPDDVEIIEDEDLEEELEDEEEISDVDDAELLNRLEAKYGRLPEPERPSGYKPPKDGGNSLDDWPGEPSDAYWRRELDSAERELRQGSADAAMGRAASPHLATSGRARYIVAKALDQLAESKRDNKLLGRAIAAYLELLKMNDKLPSNKLLDVAERTINRMHFRGTYLSAEPVHRLLIRRFPDDPAYRNNLTISYLMANRADLATEVLKETLTRWPKDRVALAHYAFVLKTQYNRLEEAVDLFQQALEGDAGPANEPRFYFHLGDSLLLLARYAEAHEVHKRAAKLGHFLSPAQRSLYNVDRLKSRPWWNVDKTPYAKLARALEKSWKAILREGEAARALYVEEKEGLRERGDWSQLDLFARGREIPDRCSRAPVTCSIVQAEPAATGCRRGQIKFSSMEPGTHVRPHVGPTNCRLRMHLALSNTDSTYLRVDKETRQWQVGKVLLFDDSFEHEVWHNGTATRLVLIVDVWHPDLTAAERRSLPAI